MDWTSRRSDLRLCESEQKYVRDHGGEVTVSSEPGAGTEVVVFLPASAGDDERPDGAEVSIADSLPRLRVLLVDDEEMVLDPTAMLLGRLGHEVHGFLSSAASLEEFRLRPADFDVAIVDQTMPELMGVDPCARDSTRSGTSPTRLGS